MAATKSPLVTLQLYVGVVPRAPRRPGRLAAYTQIMCAASHLYLILLAISTDVPLRFCPAYCER